MEQNPWIHIWTDTRNTIQRLLDDPSDKSLIWIICLFGVTVALEQASLRSAGDTVSLPIILVLSLVLGPLIGWLSWMLISGLVYWTGSWFGGTGSWEEVRTAVAWASIPFIAKLILWVPQLLLFGREMFTTVMPSLEVEHNPLMWAAFILLELVDLILTVWYYVVLSKSIGEAHDFSAWKGFFALIIGILLFLLPFVFLGILFRMA